MFNKYYRAGKTPALFFYLGGVVRAIVPRWYHRWRGRRMLRKWESRKDADYLRWRRDFYCRSHAGAHSEDKDTGLIPARDVKMGRFHSRYAIDANKALCHVPGDAQIRFHAGDVWNNPDYPTLTKARRLNGRNEDNAVILNLDSIRHWVRPKDTIPFSEKKPVLFFRGDIYDKPERIRFFEQWADNEMFDLGDTNRLHPSKWEADFVTVPEHFQYQFILALEGYDMASSLQWIMATNCVPVMPRPTVDGWLMHSRLEPGVHYVEIARDFSDVGEKIRYYIDHPAEAEKISMESKKWMAQFSDKKRERLISLLVVDKYLDK